VKNNFIKLVTYVANIEHRPLRANISVSKTKKQQKLHVSK